MPQTPTDFENYLRNSLNNQSGRTKEHALRVQLAADGTLTVFAHPTLEFFPKDSDPEKRQERIRVLNTVDDQRTFVFPSAQALAQAAAAAAAAPLKK